MVKTRQDNNMTDRTDVIYIENEIKFLWPIDSGMVYDKNQTKQ